MPKMLFEDILLCIGVSFQKQYYDNFAFGDKNNIDYLSIDNNGDNSTGH